MNEFISPGELAMVHANLGEKTEALRLLAQAVHEQDYYINYIYVDANFDALRDDPRFNKMLKKANFVR